MSDTDFWKKKNIITVDDKVSFPKIELICDLFDIEIRKVKRGFQWTGGEFNPINPEYLIWWPTGDRPKDWQNQIFKQGMYIQESHTDINERSEHYEKYKDSKQKRPTFYKDKSYYYPEYTFTGVYIVDTVKSNAKDGLFWKRISKGFNIKECKEI
jgi:hypothetical protein